MAHLYTAYGRQIRSEIPLPELRAGAAHADLVIGLEEPTEERPPAGSSSIITATPQQVELYWPRAGWGRIRDGRSILLTPHRQSDQSALRLFILGAALPVALHQLGRIVLHASAACIDGTAVAFLGSSGRGKSTIAATMHKLGFPALADDIVPLRIDADTVTTSMGFPQLRLHPDAINALQTPPSQLEELHPDLDKCAWRTDVTLPDERIRVGCLYVLAPHSTPAITEIPTQEAFKELLGNCYTARLIDATGRSGSYLEQIARLVATVPIRRLAAVPDASGIPHLVTRILADLRTLQ